jgi:hypothetical protein
MSRYLESVAARLRPFDFSMIAGELSKKTHPLYPIFLTGGLVFPYTPDITEQIQVNYDPVEVVHTNEAFHSYKSTANRRITLSNVVFTCDTFENASYALAALHFFRSYSMMDFGRGRTGRPPSPMWFSAYGSYAYKDVPVLFTATGFKFPTDVDLVGVPEPGTTQYAEGRLGVADPGLRNNRVRDILGAGEIGNILSGAISRPGSQGGGAGGSYTWLPAKFELDSVQLIVQHTPKHWRKFNLDDYRSGRMLLKSGSFETHDRISSLHSQGMFDGGGNSMARLPESIIDKRVQDGLAVNNVTGDDVSGLVREFTGNTSPGGLIQYGPVAPGVLSTTVSENRTLDTTFGIGIGQRRLDQLRSQLERESTRIQGALTSSTDEADPFTGSGIF